jgi:hypothetical protein
MRRKETPKDDSSDLGLRARVAFAATEDETEESDKGSNYEVLTNEDLHKYVDEAIDEVNKTKSNSSHVRKGETHQTS